MSKKYTNVLVTHHAITRYKERIKDCSKKEVIENISRDVLSGRVYVTINNHGSIKKLINCGDIDYVILVQDIKHITVLTVYISLKNLI